MKQNKKLPKNEDIHYTNNNITYRDGKTTIDFNKKQQNYYKLTIDKVHYNMNEHPEKTDHYLLNALLKLCTKHNLYVCSKVHMGYKHHKLNIRRLHLHTTVLSFHYIKYTTCKIRGYSIKIEYIPDKRMMINWLYYICQPKNNDIEPITFAQEDNQKSNVSESQDI